MVTENLPTTKTTKKELNELQNSSTKTRSDAGSFFEHLTPALFFK